jgi:hypothetical protein
MYKSEKLEKVNSLSRSETKRQKKRIRSKARQQYKKLCNQ